MSTNRKSLSAEQANERLATVERRFQSHMKRHKGLDGSSVRARLEAKR